MKNKSLSFILTSLLLVAAGRLSAQSWNLTGNSGTNVNTFLGTIDGRPLVLRTKNIERVRITPSGKIGIGTQTPDARFDVAVGNNVTLSTTDSFLLGKINSNNLAFDFNEVQARFNGAGSRLYLNSWGGDVWLGNHNGSSVAALYTATDGRTGIGSNTVQAGYALTVNPFLSGGAIYINDPGGGYIALCTKSGNTGEGLRMNISSTTNPFSAIRGHTDGDGFGVLAEATGQTGFGVEGYSSQSYGVWGGTGNSSTYAAYFSGSVFTTGFYSGSDEKLKQNIHDFSSAMDIINQLHPKQYSYRQDGDYKLMNLPLGDHYGLIAQDVEKVLPGLVKDTKFFTSKADPTRTEELRNTADIDFKALNYTELIPVMIKGMQEQQSIIGEQQQQINELMQMVQALSAAQSSSLRSSDGINRAWMRQNTPNPFNQNTVIHYFVPSSANNAQLCIYSMNGKLLKSYTLVGGMNDVNIAAGTFSSGEYIYSLLIDGKKIDSKNMTITK